MATTGRTADSSGDSRKLSRQFGLETRSRRGARKSEARRPRRNQELFKFGAARLLVDRGGRFESAMAFTGRCGGETGPDSDPSGAVGESPVETRRHRDGGSSAGSCGDRNRAFGRPNTTNGKGFPRQIQACGWPGRVTGLLSVFLLLTRCVRVQRHRRSPC